ncbi:MAG: SAM-dependent methyltransferase [Chloroflexi bacterium AL-W]|nr:SAM-dependent methyltransferase [Chloroflexi bacterium AL-N1]NOK71259.1 SAM-dependent methyltransferase [Chloroflexi bacterium AL-N10]NOK77634.1 SAM-dependent methyltransferase [Chloroflexi bacterium AL-N5]NOK84485.1 SAM-dependent methyltransferase [Chloroflexi bacterium AL-W]NOK92936.1 SAM-dependent methyltransferase [Chloroflexi bacterium AL-N15]
MLEQIPQPIELDADREAELTERIDQWLSHMTWRPDFARWRESRIWQERVQQDRLHLIERYGGALAGRRILDLGSGMGGGSVALALAGAVPLAFEYNRAYCDITRLRAARYDLALPVINGVGESLPFADQSFDLAICWDVVEHVQNPEQLLAELARVLRPGGRVLLTIINRYALRDPHYHMPLLNWIPRPLAETIIEQQGRSKGGSAFSDRQKLSEMHYYTMSSFRRLAARYGFAVGDIREDHVRRGEGSASGLKGQVRDVLRRVGLAHIAYLTYRTFVQGTYELLLVKTIDAS